MDYQHQPTPGPAVWIGAGLLVAVGGASMLWAAGGASLDLLPIIGAILLITGLACAGAGFGRFLRARRIDRRRGDRPE